MIIELANGAEGYFPPPDQHVWGGYTTWPARTACLDVHAEPKIIDAFRDLWLSMPGRPGWDIKYHSAIGPLTDSMTASKPIAYWSFEEAYHREPRDHMHNIVGEYEPGT